MFKKIISAVTALTAAATLFVVPPVNAATTVPVPENGVWVNDDMNYATPEDIPMYNNGAVPFGFDLGTVAANGTIKTDGDNIIVTKTTAPSKGEFDLYKYIAPSKDQMLTGNQIIEFAFTPINKPLLYITISDDTWKGPQTINYDGSKNGEVSWGSAGTTKTVGNGKAVKVTIALNHKERKLKAWLNDSVWETGLAYRTDGYYNPGHPDVLKLLFEVKNANAANTGLKLDYVRVLEDASSYAGFYGKKENLNVADVVESGTDSIELPTNGEYSTISWASDNEAVIAPDGTVTHGAEDVVVNLTPTYTNKVVGSSAQGAPIAVTVKARAAQTIYSDTVVVDPDDELIANGQYAVGFLGTFESKNTGLAPTFGFKLTYPDKEDMITTIDAHLETSLKAGIILTYTDEDGFDINNLTVRSYVTE